GGGTGGGRGGGAGGGPADPGQRIAADQREEQQEAEHEEQVRAEALALQRSFGELLPEDQAGDHGDARAPAELGEHDQDGDARERQEAQGVREAEHARVYRGRTRPRRTRSRVTKASTGTSLTSDAHDAR